MATTTLSERGIHVPDVFQGFTGYNNPVKAKHRKRTVDNLKSQTLLDTSSAVLEQLLSTWITTPAWTEVRKACEELAASITRYGEHLKEKTNVMKKHHQQTEHPPLYTEESCNLRYIPFNPCAPKSLKKLEKEIQSRPEFEFIEVSSFAPENRKERYFFIKDLVDQGLGSRCILCTFSYGGNVGNYHFIWKRSGENDASAEDLNRSLEIVSTLKDQLPNYHRRDLRQSFVRKFGVFSGPLTKSHILREIYKELTHDNSAPRTSHEGEVDKRMTQALLAEDPDIIVDLRHDNDNESDKYKVFWDRMAVYLNERSAVHERRHEDVNYLAAAISVRDLIEEVTKTCPDNTPVPSQQWVRYQFHPKNPRSNEARKYKQHFNLKLMVQQRMFRKYHPDAHYCAAYYRYLREFALMYREHCSLVSLDDKHRCKVGEPGYPVAAVERGRQVLVSTNLGFQVGDHDFTKFSLIPSVQLHVNIPNSIEESFHQGTVFVSLKDAVWQSSSGMRHAVELEKSLLQSGFDKPMVVLYTDGGPDHNVTFIKNQLSLVALFLVLDLDVLIAMRTAPDHSWRNPVERVMSGINIGLQCIGLMRQEGPEVFEKAVRNVSNLKGLRKMTADMKDEVGSTLEPCRELMQSIIKRLMWSGNFMQETPPASDQDIEAMWDLLAARFGVDENITKRSLKSNEKLADFFDHCCTFRHYSFSIAKCGNPQCTICKPVRMDEEVFCGLHQLPDPMPKDSEHYKTFEEVYGTETTEQHRPSLRETKNKGGLPFSASVQHVKNAGMMVCCEECSMWRLLYSKKKLGPREKKLLEGVVEDIHYTCGSSLADLDLPQSITDVYVRDHNCKDHVEKLYYSAGYKSICIHCSSEDVTEVEVADVYPQCADCEDIPRVLKRKSAK